MDVLEILRRPGGYSKSSWVALEGVPDCRRRASGGRPKP